MPTRRDLLKSALLLPALPSFLNRSALAQDVSWLFTSHQREETLRFDDLPSHVQPVYDKTINSIYFELDTPRMRFSFGESIDDIVKRLRPLSGEAANYAKATDDLTQQLLMAEVVAGWVRHNVRYLLRPQAERRTGNNPDYILRERQPKCDCSGFTALAVRMSKELGLSCEHAGGTTRPYGGRVDNKDVHGWVVYNINGKVIPADTTNSPTTDETRYFEPGCFARLYGKGFDSTAGFNVLPLREQEWETFLARYYTHYYGKSNYKWLEAEPFMDFRWETWREMDSKYVSRLSSQMMTDRRWQNEQDCQVL